MMKCDMMRYSIVIPVLNQLDYTSQCVDSLLQCGTSPKSLLIINNGSSDGTASWLTAHPQIQSITNEVNLGCGGAWTQGALATCGEWILLMNNDVIVCRDFATRLLDAADNNTLDVVSPAVFEGDLDYDFESKAEALMAAMGTYVRLGQTLGACFAVRRNVLHEVGFFDTDRDLGGHEDGEFMERCLRHGKRVGITGAAVIHHFGSVTQRALTMELGVKHLGDHRYYYRKLGMGLVGRKLYKFRKKRDRLRNINSEMALYGMTVHMYRDQGRWAYL